MATVSTATVVSVDNTQSPRICVIGAGVNGLCVTKHLMSCNLQNITIFETLNRIGGIWQYEANPTYPNPLYKNMTTNIHRDMMHFPDLDFENECKETHPHHSFILEYIKYYTKQFKLEQFIKFNHKIISVIPPNINDAILNQNTIFPQWTVTYNDIHNNLIKSELFDIVIVCNGHFIERYIPEFDSFSITKIKCIHSRQYREPRCSLYNNKLIVIIGAGSSGRDIGKEIHNNCNNVKIYHVIHSQYNYGSKTNYINKCYIKKFTEYSVEFDDGIIIAPDLVIFCTGYQHHIPFLNNKQFMEHPLIKNQFGFKCNGRSVNGLYQHCIYPQLPTIFFPGINHGVIPFFHAYYQSMWITKIISDIKCEFKNNEIIWSSKYLPNKNIMIEWMKNNRQFSGVRKQHFMPHQSRYFKYICKQIGEQYPPFKKKKPKKTRSLT